MIEKESKDKKNSQKPLKPIKNKQITKPASPKRLTKIDTKPERTEEKPP